MNGHVIEVDLLANRGDLDTLVTHGRILLSAVPATWRLAVTLRFEGPVRDADQAHGVAFAKGIGSLLLRLDGLAVDEVEPAAPASSLGAPRGDVRVDLRDPALAVDSLCEALAALTHLRPGEPNVVLEITEIPG